MKKLLIVLLALILVIPINVSAETNLQVDLVEENIDAYYYGDTVELKLNINLNRHPSEFKTIFFTFDISEGLTFESVSLQGPGLDESIMEKQAKANSEGVQRFINFNFKNPKLLGDAQEFSIIIRAKVNDKKSEGDHLYNRLIAHYQLTNGTTVSYENEYKSKYTVATRPSVREEPEVQTEPEPEPNLIDQPSTQGEIQVHEPFMNGYPGTKLFKPNNQITRAEISAIISRIMIGGEVSQGTSSFKDVDDWRWYGKYVAHMEREEIITGHGDRTFRPQDNISRAELATIISRALDLNDTMEITFSDVKTKYWARENIKKVVKAGIMTGYPDGSFKPYQKVTRAEAATTINRALGRSPDISYIDAHNIENFSDIKNHWAYYEIVEATYKHTAFVKDGQEIYQ